MMGYALSSLKSFFVGEGSRASVDEDRYFDFLVTEDAWLAEDRILLVDNDQEFVHRAKQCALVRGVKLEVMDSFWDLVDTDSSVYSAIIINTQLPEVRGPELLELIDDIGINVPVILMSSSRFLAHDRYAWPPCVKDVTSKRKGPSAIIGTALEVAYQS